MMPQARAERCCPHSPDSRIIALRENIARSSFDLSLEILDWLRAHLRDLALPEDPHDAITPLLATTPEQLLLGLNKRVDLVSGSPVKTPPRFAQEYLAVKLPIADHEALERVLKLVGEFEWTTVMPGILPGLGFWDTALLVQADLLAARNNLTAAEVRGRWFPTEVPWLRATTRTMEAFVASNWYALDRDKLPDGMEHLSPPEAWWKEMGRAIPALAGVRATVVPSTTGRVVFEDGTPAFADSHGLHAWIHVSNGPRKQTDLQKLKRRIVDHLVLAGLGQCVRTPGQGRASGHRFDAIFDPSNLSVERPCFDGAPSVGEGLYLLPPETFTLIPEGGRFDAGAVPPLTDAESTKVRDERQRRTSAKVKKHGIKSRGVRVDRAGRVFRGRGPGWKRLLNGLGATDACRDPLLHVAVQAAREGVPRSTVMAEVRRRLDDPNALLTRDDGLVLKKLEHYWNEPGELESMLEWAWRTIREAANDAPPAWLALPKRDGLPSLEEVTWTVIRTSVPR